MKNASTFENLDWELEAARIKVAFGVRGKCAFVMDDQNDGFVFGPKNRLHADRITDGFALNIEYGEDYRWYEVFIASQPERRTSISLDWDGQPHRGRGPLYHAEFLARGLFHLGLINPEVEARLGVTVTAQQKLEWKREYEAPYEF